jgi:uncharacterized membrane protein YbhN (UPF0104 family)
MTFKGRLGVSLLAVSAVGAGYFTYINRSDFAHVWTFDWHFMAVLCLLFAIVYFFVSEISRELFSTTKLKIARKESLLMAFSTGFYNLITPFRGGLAFRAVYLKKKYKFAYTDFLATLAASYIIIFLVGGVFGLASTLYLYHSSGVMSWPLLIIFAGATVSMLGIVVISPTFKETGNRWVDKFIRVINGWHLIRKDKQVVAKIAFYSAIQLVLGAIMTYLQFKAFGIDIPIAAAVFLAAIGSLSILIAITPAGLGITEAVTVFSALTIGIAATESLSAAILGRLVSVVVLFIAGPISSYYLMKK